LTLFTITNVVSLFNEKENILKAIPMSLGYVQWMNVKIGFAIRITVSIFSFGAIHSLTSHKLSPFHGPVMLCERSKPTE